MEISINILIHRYLKDNQFNRAAREFEHECKYFKKVDMSTPENGQEFLMPKLQNIILEYCALKKAEYEMQKGQFQSINSLWQQFDSLITQIKFLTVGRQPKTLTNRPSSATSYKRVLAAVASQIQVNDGQMQPPHNVPPSMTGRPLVEPLQDFGSISASQKTCASPEYNSSGQPNVHNLPVAEEHHLKSPKRKRIRPRKLDSNESKDQRSEPVSSCKKIQESVDVSQNVPLHGELNAIFDTLLNSRSLQEKIANNINKVATGAHLLSTRVDEGSCTENTHSTINVEEVLNMTRSDPSFESLFSVLDDLDISPSAMQTPVKMAGVPIHCSQFPEFQPIADGGFESDRFDNAAAQLLSRTNDAPPSLNFCENGQLEDFTNVSNMDDQKKTGPAAKSEVLQGKEINLENQVGSSLCNLYIKQTRRTSRKKSKLKKQPPGKSKLQADGKAKCIILSGAGSVSNTNNRDIWKSDFVPNLLQRNLVFAAPKDDVISSSDKELPKGSDQEPIKSKENTKARTRRVDIAEDKGFLLDGSEGFSSSKDRSVSTQSKKSTQGRIESITNSQEFGSAAYDAQPHENLTYLQEPGLLVSAESESFVNKSLFNGDLESSEPMQKTPGECRTEPNKALGPNKKQNLNAPAIQEDDSAFGDNFSNRSNGGQQCFTGSLPMNQTKKHSCASPASNIFEKINDLSIINNHAKRNDPQIVSKEVHAKEKFDVTNDTAIDDVSSEDYRRLVGEKCLKSGVATSCSSTVQNAENVASIPELKKEKKPKTRSSSRNSRKNSIKSSTAKDLENSSTLSGTSENFENSSEILLNSEKQKGSLATQLQTRSESSLPDSLTIEQQKSLSTDANYIGSREDCSSIERGLVFESRKDEAGPSTGEFVSAPSGDEAGQDHYINVDVIFENTNEGTVALIRPVEVNGIEQGLQPYFVIEELSENQMVCSDVLKDGHPILINERAFLEGSSACVEDTCGAKTAMENIETARVDEFKEKTELGCRTLDADASSPEKGEATASVDKERLCVDGKNTFIGEKPLPSAQSKSVAPALDHSKTPKDRSQNCFDYNDSQSQLEPSVSGTKSNNTTSNEISDQGHETSERIKSQILFLSLQADEEVKVDAANKGGKPLKEKDAQIVVRTNENSLGELGFKVTSSEVLTEESMKSNLSSRLIERSLTNENNVVVYLSDESSNALDTKGSYPRLGSSNCSQRVSPRALEKNNIMSVCNALSTSLEHQGKVETVSPYQRTASYKRIDPFKRTGSSGERISEPFHSQAGSGSLRQQQELASINTTDVITSEDEYEIGTREMSRILNLSNDNKNLEQRSSKARKNTTPRKRKRPQQYENDSTLHKEKVKEEEAVSLPADVLKGLNVDQFLSKLQYSSK
ncbi:protein NPAT-like [Rhopilema esculentum]|uniref:protein NPAT-like n=1 Tax=Rhopilema esculentum TaxID=499914 RepID=UPI0031D8D98B